jgi:ABC-type multidrug transport system, permease component
MTGLILRIVRQLLNDKRSMALIFIAPLLILSLLYLLLGESGYVPKITVNKTMPDAVIAELKKQNVELTVSDNKDIDTKILEEKTTDAIVTMDKNGVSIKMLEAGNSKASYVTKALKEATSKLNPANGMNFTYLYGSSDATMFSSLGYVLLGILSFFFVFIISGISFVRERSSGTLERLMLTPVKRWSVVAGYTLGFGIFAALQSAIIILFTKYVLGIYFMGSVFLAILTMILLAFTAVSMGALVSIFSNSEFQVMQFIPIIIIPQIFFSGLIPIDTLPFGLGRLAYIIPIYYGCTALENILIKGYGIIEISGYLLMLAAIIFVLFVINTLALKKYRKL